jgi:uncharacterized integral membrane protein (TIGR00698 family)
MIAEALERTNTRTTTITVATFPRPLPFLRAILFVELLGLCLMPWGSPALALALGGAFALLMDNPFPAQSKRASGLLLKACVVLLGFGMDLQAVLKAGADGAVFAAVTIIAALLLGAWLGRRLGIAPRTSALISCGTAICGGSAIAAVGSVTKAEEGEVTVAIGTVFLLNATALYLFPSLGHALHLTQTQFGTWAGVAIHDISSVVGAASHYGLTALQTATAVKLSRALWIVPVALIAAKMLQRPSKDRDTAAAPTRAKSVWAATANAPWFVGLFLLASVARTWIPGVVLVAPIASHLATVGLTATLFLIGAGLSRKTLQAVGVRPLVQGVILWAAISAGSLLAILITVR